MTTCWKSQNLMDKNQITMLVLAENKVSLQKINIYLLK